MLSELYHSIWRSVVASCRLTMSCDKHIPISCLCYLSSCKPLRSTSYIYTQGKDSCSAQWDLPQCQMCMLLLYSQWVLFVIMLQPPQCALMVWLPLLATFPFLFSKVIRPYQAVETVLYVCLCVRACVHALMHMYFMCCIINIHYICTHDLAYEYTHTHLICMYTMLYYSTGKLHICNTPEKLVEYCTQWSSLSLRSDGSTSESANSPLL